MNEKKIYRIETCKFQRQKDGEWENGIMINEGEAIFDSDGKIPTNVWDGRRWSGLAVDFSDIETWLPVATKCLGHIEKLILGSKEDSDPID